MADGTTKIKRLLIMVVVLSVGLVVWIFIQSRQNPIPILLPEKATQSVLTLSRIHHTATKDGAVQWELEAKSAEMQSNNGQVVLKDPEVVFFLEDGKRVKLSANKGILNTKNNNIKVHGNVSVAYDRYTLKTEELTYHHKRRRLQANVPVQIIGQAFDLKAASMIYNLNTDQTIFKGDVKGTIYERPAI